MDTWNRLTAVRGRRDWKGLAREHICIYVKPIDRDNVVKAGRGEGQGQDRG